MIDKQARRSENEIIRAAVLWALASGPEIEAAGGDALAVLKAWPAEVLGTLVRNDLRLTFTGAKRCQCDTH